MTRDEFLEMMDRDFAEITEINRTKGHDYAGEQDALANFKRECAVAACTARTLRRFCIRCEVNGQAQLQVDIDQARAEAERKAAA